jgi:hypothetical protein
MLLSLPQPRSPNNRELVESHENGNRSSVSFAGQRKGVAQRN